MFAFDFTDWGNWLILGAGLACALVVIALGRAAVGRRKEPTLTELPSDPASDPFLEGSAMERRGALRRRGRQVSVLVSDEAMSTEPREGWIIDRSGGGLCIALSQETPIGTVLAVRACDAPVTAPWVQAEVRYCRQHDQEWEHGCKFVKTPPWGVLLQFG